MVIRAPVAPALITWARERAGLSPDELLHRFPKLEDWEAGARRPTLNQLEKFANAVHCPIGYLFLPSPPEERLPIPDFRTMDGQMVRQPSPNLIDTIHVCQERQGWYREFALTTHQPSIDFVGTLTVETPVEQAAQIIATKIKFDLQQRQECTTWEAALRLFIRNADDIGVMVMVSGVVQNNTHRPLDPEEFRGFALVDPHAPLVFINGADSKAGQMFTLAHELAHLWLGASALSNSSAAPLGGHRREEVWCNAVAAELLVPLTAIWPVLTLGEPLSDTLRRLARRFKVSTLVILRRLLDAGAIDRDTFEGAWRTELERFRQLARSKSDGGNFYRTTLTRISRRFACALVESTLEGHTLYRDAFRMLGVSKTETFNNIGREVGAML